MKGRYIFIEANEDEKAQAIMLEKGLDGPKKIFWRLEKLLPDLVHHKRFKVYHDDLIKFNLKINLISKKSTYDADILHFLDSYLSAEKILEDCDSEIIYDFGSGNGFPGLVMAILDQKRKFVLLDNDSRKVEFLKYMATKLALKNVAAHKADISKLKEASVNAAVCRGLASVTKSLLMARRAFKPGSSYYHLKGPHWSKEVAEIPAQLLGLWTPSMLYQYKLSSDLGERFLIKTVIK